MTTARLRPLGMSDLGNIMHWVNDQEVVGNFANFKVPISRDEEQKEAMPRRSVDEKSCITP